MNNYACSVFYHFDKVDLKKMLYSALNVLGFDPTYMTIYADSDLYLEDIPYNESVFFSFLERHPIKLQITNRIYDEQFDYSSFFLEINYDYKILNINWSNYNLSFLLGSDAFFDFLTNNSLIVCYCYNINDCFLQTNENIDYFKANSTNEIFKTSINEYGDTIIDVSQNWGRKVRTNGLDFIVAPLMWFGKGFYDFIPKKELLKFKYARQDLNVIADLINIKLFDLYECPVTIENRKIQKEFWDFFKLEKRIKEYSRKNESNGIDAEESMQEYILKLKQKRNKRSQ